MSTNRFILDKKASWRWTTVATATTLTAEETANGFVVVSGNVAATLPVASEAMKGNTCLIAASHASGCTIVVAAGFGGAGSGTDTLTLAQGQMALVGCDGDYWYALHVAAAA